jgi:hypothetical protein
MGCASANPWQRSGLPPRRLDAAGPRARALARHRRSAHIPDVSFVGGIRGTDYLVAQVDSGAAAVAFSMYPTTLDQLMDIADAGQIMPPKSTWFEPKLRSGLFIHTFEGKR